MDALKCREWRSALLLVWSGCAGSLDNAEDYQTPVPVRDAGPTRAPEAGRAPASSGQFAGWGGAGKPANAGQVAGSGGAAGWNPPQGGRVAGGPDDNTQEDAGVADSAAPPLPEPMACDFRALMMAKCGNATCHGAPGSSTGLDLTSPMLAARVEDRAGKGACSDKLLIDRDNPRESKLYLKVSGSSCGSQMPLGGQFNADEQACVLTWIEQL